MELRVEERTEADLVQAGLDAGLGCEVWLDHVDQGCSRSVIWSLEAATITDVPV